MLRNVRLIPAALLVALLLIAPAWARGSSGGHSSSGHSAKAGKSTGPVHVNGYYRKDGTYVPSHMRSAPDGNFSNNWSTKGNVNPYTGKEGTRVTPPSGYGLGAAAGAAVGAAVLGDRAPRSAAGKESPAGGPTSDSQRTGRSQAGGALPDLPDFSKRDLHGELFKNADLRAANFRGADLFGACFVGADLRGADFREADLTAADLDYAVYDSNTRWPRGYDPRQHGGRPWNGQTQ